MKKTIINTLIILLTLFTLALHAQDIKIYKTYNDYKNNKYEEGYKLKNYSYFNKRVKLFLKKGNEKFSMRCNEMWGFDLEGHLFVIARNDDFFPVKLLSKGDFFYFENGVSHMSIILKNKKSDRTYMGNLAYFSKGLNENIIPIYRVNGRYSKQYKRYKKENPQYSTLFECIKSSHDRWSTDKIRKCF